MNAICPNCHKAIEDVCETDTYGFPQVDESVAAGIECQYCKAKLVLYFVARLAKKEA